ncbi:MAG: hypothetical protein ABID54_09195, partial [Pseudomonadota bacterium]
EVLKWINGTMKMTDEKLGRVKEIAFIGKVAASLSHEIKNVLATINESLGLMGDLFMKADQNKVPDLMRLIELNMNMREQIKGGVEIVNRLNRFAHSMDEQVAQSDLNNVVALTVDIAKRLARLKRVGLETKLADNPVNIQMDPFKVEQIAFGCIEYLLNLPTKKNRITLALEEIKGDAIIIISNDSSNSDSPRGTDPIAEKSGSDMAFLIALLKEMGGSIEFTPSSAGNKITVSFPAKKS